MLTPLKHICLTAAAAAVAIFLQANTTSVDPSASQFTAEEVSVFNAVDSIRLAEPLKPPPIVWIN